MAMINCLECGKDVSDKAVACPNCGVGIAKQTVVPMPAKKKCIFSIIIIVTVILLSGIGVFVGIQMNNERIERERVAEELRLEEERLSIMYDDFPDIPDFGIFTGARLFQGFDTNKGTYLYYPATFEADSLFDYIDFLNEHSFYQTEPHSEGIVVSNGSLYIFMGVINEHFSIIINDYGFIDNQIEIIYANAIELMNEGMLNTAYDLFLTLPIEYKNTEYYMNLCDEYRCYSGFYEIIFRRILDMAGNDVESQFFDDDGIVLLVPIDSSGNVRIIYSNTKGKVMYEGDFNTSIRFTIPLVGEYIVGLHKDDHSDTSIAQSLISPAQIWFEDYVRNDAY